MNRTQLEHIIRAAAGNEDATDIVIIGSQALLGTFDVRPVNVVVSTAATLLPIDFIVRRLTARQAQQLLSIHPPHE